MRKGLNTFFLLIALCGPALVAGAQPKDKVLSGRHLPTPTPAFYSASQLMGHKVATPAAIAAFLEGHFPAAQYGNLRMASQVQSPLGTHYVFRQYLRDKPVYKTELKLNVSPQGEVLSMAAGLHNLPKKRSTKAVKATETMAAQHMLNLLGTNLAKADYTVEETVFMADNAMHAGVLVTYGSRITTIGSKEILLDATGLVRDEYDLITNYKHDHGHSHSHTEATAAPAAAMPAKAMLRDTAVSALIYATMPKPAGPVNRKAMLFAQPEQAKQLLNANRQTVELQAAFRNDTFLLQSPFCVVKEFDPPAFPVAYSLSPVFNFQLGDEGFEQLNVLYHITAWQKYLQHLGFTNLVNYPIEVDANGWGGQDQSSYSSFTNTLSFGIGGVADAQDPQVIVHEYSHAISRSASSGAAIGYERKVLEEANADYFAVSYKKAADPTDWQRIFTWDGHNEFWPGRMAVSGKKYPRDMKGDIYEDAVIWTATLMQIQEQIGREATDKLVVASMYSYSSYLDMRSAAMLLLQADNLLYGGRHHAELAELLSNRGILPRRVFGNPNMLAPAGPRVAEAAAYLSFSTESPTPTFSSSAAAPASDPAQPQRKAANAAHTQQPLFARYYQNQRKAADLQAAPAALPDTGLGMPQATRPLTHPVTCTH